MPWVTMARLLGLAESQGRADALAAENVRLAKLLEEQTAETRRVTEMLAKLRKEGYAVLDTADAWPDGRYSFDELDKDPGDLPLADGPPQRPGMDLETEAEMAEVRSMFGLGG